MEWCNEFSREFLSRGYLLPGQTAEERLHIIAQRAEAILGIYGFADKFLSNMSKGWYSLSTPIWANFGTGRGLPISCFGSHISDTMESILRTQAEVGMMTKLGGGTAAYFGDLRGRGALIGENGVSSGAVHFMQLFETLLTVVSQGSTRRGNFAAYLPIEHHDVKEFLNIRTEGNAIQDTSFGVTVSDAWMNNMITGDKENRDIWAKVIESRINTGYPYILFTDNIKKGAPSVYSDMPIKSSNLCSEIMLPTNENESFVCDLSSMNILHYDDWKDTDAVQTLTYFLDAVMTEFINKAENIPYMDRAVTFAKRHRALGVGWLGWHSYLQKHRIPFESMTAKYHNAAIARNIQENTYAASEELGKMFGCPLYLQGHNRRNSTLMAIAPTKSSSFILGQVSEGIEPNRTNYYIKDLQKGKYTIKNPYLENVLSDHSMNNTETWQSIMQYGGSVQHLDFLSDEERSVFKTFGEITPKEIVIQAAQRQKYIDQGQSLNLMIHPSIPVKDINALLIETWKMGIKALYYQIGVNAAQQFSRDILNCVSCE